MHQLLIAFGLSAARYVQTSALCETPQNFQRYNIMRKKFIKVPQSYISFRNALQKTPRIGFSDGFNVTGVLKNETEFTPACLSFIEERGYLSFSWTKLRSKGVAHRTDGSCEELDNGSNSIMDVRSLSHFINKYLPFAHTTYSCGGHFIPQNRNIQFFDPYLCINVIKHKSSASFLKDILALTDDISSLRLLLVNHSAHQIVIRLGLNYNSGLMWDYNDTKYLISNHTAECIAYEANLLTNGLLSCVSKYGKNVTLSQSPETHSFRKRLNKFIHG